MSKEGLAEAPVTTPAPTMYQKIEQGENVARGCVEVTEIIAYDVVGKKKNEDGKDIPVEKGRRPCFCQDSEDIIIFKDKNKTARIETFGIQLRELTAIEYINNPENMKQFGRKV